MWPAAWRARAPILVICQGVVGTSRLMPVYLARAEGELAPRAETHGLLLLSLAEIRLLATAPLAPRPARTWGL